MSDTFGLKIGIEGEAEFRNSIREINNSFKVLASEMNLVTSEFDKNDQSIQSFTARNSVLTKEIDAQKDKISTLEKALSNASTSFGESDKRTQAWAVQLNNAKAGLNSMERELANNNKAITESNSGMAEAEKADKGLADAIKDIDASFKVLGSEMALVSSQFDKHEKSVAALTSKNSVLTKEIDAQKEKVGNLEKALANSTAAFGENDKKTQAWAEKLNNAKTELNGMERELSSNEKTIRDVARGYDDTGKKLDEFGHEVEDASEKTSIFAEVLKANLAADAIKAGLGALVDMIKSVGSAVSDYISEGSDMAKAAAENHAKLEQVMRNTMDASDAEIQSIMDLAKAQENLGVVSATAQVGGAQELGTYLEKTDTLKTLLPVMNDMIAQQYGVNASQESAVGIGTMLGKVMNGQVGALSRYGYTFDEVQENILKFGTEAERAAVLAEVVGESVGGMNEALAQTDAGKMGSLLTVLDNTKIKVGEVANDFQAQIMGRMLPSVDALTDAFLGVLSGDGSVEDMAATFTDVFNEIEGIITDFLPILLELGGEILTAVVTGIADNLDTIVDAVLSIVNMLLETITDLLPTILDAGMELLFSLIDGIIQALPMLVEAALNIIMSLAQGLGEALPELIPVIIETIIYVVETLLDNLEPLLDAAFAIIMGLADGLIEALPVLIDALPHIIETIINFLVNNLPRLIEMGVELIIKLAFGLIQAIPHLLMALPQILASLINGMVQWYGNIAEMGKNIIKKLWDGIVSMAQWLADSFSDMIAGIVNSVVNAINSIFGTNIPTMKVKAKVDAAPVSVGVDTSSAKRTQGVMAEISKETEKQTTASNDAILKSAYESAEERMAIEKNVTKGKSNEAKEQEKAAKALAKEEEKTAKELAKEKERIAKENADAINKLGADLTKALKEQYSEQKSAYLDALNDEVDAVKSASYEKMRIYDEEYAEKMKLLDDEESYRLSAIQAEIDAIDAKTKAEDRAKRQKDYEDKLVELKVKFSAATTVKEQEDIQKEVNRLVEARQREITLEQRNTQKDLLKQQLDEEKQRMKEAKDALQQSKLEELDIQKEALKKQFDELMSAENIKAEALKLMTSGQQEDLLALLDSYNPSWRDAGKSFAEMLGVGIADGKEKIERSLADTLSLLNVGAGNVSQTSNTTTQTQPTSFNTAQTSLQAEKFEKDMLASTNDIMSALASITQAIRQSAKEIYAQFQNPLRDEFFMIGAKLDSVVSAVNNLYSALDTPRITITNNFNGVTAADVPHMVDRENTALLRRLQPSTA